MRYILSSFLIFDLWLLLGLLPALAQEQPTDEEESNLAPFYHRDEPMRFFMASEGGNRFTDYWISAQGMITKDTPKAFKDFLRHDKLYLGAVKEVAESDKWDKNPEYQRAVENGDIMPSGSKLLPIHIHSCDGDEEAAMELGRIAKAHDLRFEIGQTYEPSDNPSQYEIAYGECIGACLLAAMNKPYAFAKDFNPTFESELELERSKKTSENYDKFNGDVYPLSFFKTPRYKIKAYAKEMGIDFPWLDQLLPRKPGEVRYLTYWAALRLGLHIGHFDQIDPPPSETQRCPDIGYFRKR